jgi:hypothetical protein
MKSQAVINKDQRKTWPLDDDARSASLPALFPKAAANFWLDVLLLGALSTNVLTAFIDPSLHVPSGIILMLTMGVHLFLHWRLWTSVPTGLRQGKLRIQWKWLLSGALLMTFIPTVLSGMIVALIYAPKVSDFHRLSAIVFSILVVIHLYTNRKWIACQFKKAGRHV